MTNEEKGLLIAYLVDSGEIDPEASRNPVRSMSIIFRFRFSTSRRRRSSPASGNMLCTHKIRCFDPIRSMRPALCTIRVGFQCRS